MHGDDYADEVFDAVKERINNRRAVFFDRDGTLCREGPASEQDGGF